MKTYEITKDMLSNTEPVAYGYKAIRWDSGTQQDFKYGETGENLLGKLFTVTGDIEECKWGLHFSKDPAYVFNFYEPLGYNRYFKIAAYDKVIDSKDGFKSVAKTIEFIEEYDLLDYIEEIKKYNRSYSHAVNNSHAVSYSNAVSYSDAVSYSHAVSYSDAVSNSDAVSSSNAVSYSKAVSNSDAVSSSWGLRNCMGMYECLFCVEQKGKAWYVFNRKSSEERVKEIIKKILSFNWRPEFANWYEIKGNKEWWAFCFPQLQEIDNKTAWSKMPADMMEYIKSLPEFDEKIWQKLTGE